MSRRRLEIAVQAGRCIDLGQEIPNKYEKADVQFTHRFEEVRDGVYSLQYSYDATALVVGYGDGGVDVLSTITGKVEREVRKHKLHALAITCIRFNPQLHHTFLAASCEGKVYSCSLVDGTSQEVIHERGNEINCVDFSQDGLTFATAGKDFNIRIYDTQTQTLGRVFEGFSYISPDAGDASGHAQRVFALRYHPEFNEVFISGGWDNHLKVWDVRTKMGVVRTIHGPHICGDGLDIKGSQLLTGSWVANDALQIWDYGEGRLVKTVPFPHSGKGEFLYCAQYCTRQVVLAGGSGTNSAQAINVDTEQVIGEVDIGRPVQALDNTSQGRLFAVGGGGCKVRMAKMS